MLRTVRIWEGERTTVDEDLVEFIFWFTQKVLKEADRLIIFAIKFCKPGIRF